MSSAAPTAPPWHRREDADHRAPRAPFAVSVASKQEAPSADHLTRITVWADGGRAAELARALAARGFTVRVERRRFVADSTSVEGQDAKAYLGSLGFREREFQVLVELVRQRGVP